ncbi:hypothetical protein GALL_439910 [mine drainage metagenome]|uniref:Uncharacterized protein n=1 Tax=mine drainage metagenome TaxID=410659 RepID=A0A1J5PU44_9ZZZZ
MLDVEHAHVAFLPHSLALAAGDDLDVVLGQGGVQQVGHRSNLVLGVHKNGRGWQLTDKALNLANAIRQPADNGFCVGSVLQQGWRNANTVHMRWQAGVLLGTTDGADHGASKIVQLLALPVGDGDLLDIEIGEDPLQVVGRACAPSSQALIEVATGEE